MRTLKALVFGCEFLQTFLCSFADEKAESSVAWLQLSATQNSRNRISGLLAHFSEGCSVIQSLKGLIDLISIMIIL